MKNMESFWVDKSGKEYTKEEVDNNHLLNIISYLQKGGLGYNGFAKDMDVVATILNESVKRELYTDSEITDIYNGIVDFRKEIFDFNKNMVEKFLDVIFNNKEINR